jgi:hypothetical protein
MTARRYKKVPETESTDFEESKKQASEKTEYITTKIHAFFWVLSATLTLYYVDFIRIALYDTRINRQYIHSSIFY